MRRMRLRELMLLKLQNAPGRKIFPEGVPVT
jgi:hypothetical protein